MLAINTMTCSPVLWMGTLIERSPFLIKRRRFRPPVGSANDKAWRADQKEAEAIQVHALETSFGKHVGPARERNHGADETPISLKRVHGD